MVRVLILSDHGLLSGALQAVLGEEPDLAVAGSPLRAGREAGTVVLARSVRPDVVVVDVGPGRPSTWRLVQRLVAELPDSVVLVLAGRRSTGLLRRALEAGARGFATDAQAPAELADFIRRAAAGEHVIDPGVAAAAVGPPSGSPLTEREGQILRLAAEGLPTREMARRLFLAEGTVRNHLSVILRKTGSRNRLQAVQRADGAGWL